MLKIQWKTTTPCNSIKGELLQPGVTLFDNIMLEPSGKATWQDVARGIARLTQACPELPSRFGEFAETGHLLIANSRPNAKVNYTPEGPDDHGVFRKAKNEVSTYIKP
jgi:hypothetical protein